MEDPDYEPDGPREGSVEWHFARGVAAFDAGQPLDESEHFDWKCGWNSAQTRKTADFMDYRKTRSLQARDFSSSAWSKSDTEMVRTARARRIARYEERYPDFPGYYDKLMKELKGG